jgi:tRNA(Arg) A34 adenosine deaminase TadA
MPSNDADIAWMTRAISLAREGEAGAGKNPIGCVIVRDGQIIDEGSNEVDLRHDATAHAEIVAIRRAGENCDAMS